MSLQNMLPFPPLSFMSQPLKGGSWTCPLSFEYCRIAEGKTWEEALDTLKEMNDVIGRNLIDYKFEKDYYNDRIKEGILNYGKYYDIKNKVDQVCLKPLPTQFNLGRCLKNLNKLNDIVVGETTKVPYTELTGKQREVALEKAIDIEMHKKLINESEFIPNEEKDYLLDFLKGSGLSKTFLGIFWRMNKKYKYNPELKKEFNNFSFYEKQKYNEIIESLKNNGEGTRNATIGNINLTFELHKQGNIYDKWVIKGKTKDSDKIRLVDTETDNINEILKI